MPRNFAVSKTLFQLEKRGYFKKGVKSDLANTSYN